MPLDSVTVITFSLVVALVLSLFSWSLVLSPRSPRWRVSWACANTSLTLGVFLLLGQDSITAWLSIVLANGLIVAGFVLLEAGLRRFAEKPFEPWYLWVFFGVLFAGFVVLTFGWYSLVLRTVFHAGLVLLTVVRMLVLTRTGLAQDRRHNPWMLRFFEGVLVAVALSYVVRLGLVFGENSRTVLDPSNSLALIFLSTTVGMVAWTMCLVGIEVYRGQRLVEVSLATRDTMFALIAHDLKGPVGNLAALLEVAGEKGTTDEEKAATLRVAAEAARESYTLLDDLLSWARSQRGDLALTPQVLSVEGLLRESMHPLQATANRKNLTLTVKTDPDLVVWGDDSTLQTVLRNLVSNAIKYSPRGGRVTVEAWQTGRLVVVRVLDTGPGMSARVLDELANDRQLTPAPGSEGEPGTGLGLRLCQAFALANKGSLKFRALRENPNSGTEVMLTLPLPDSTLRD
ncbi:MAG: HAMP domain-containing sensor histidine kinase [Spirochaetales bacterium]